MMAPLSALSGAQVLLLATRLATDSDLHRLQVLAAERTDVLGPSLLYRILLSYLPASEENVDVLAAFLQSVLHGFQNVSKLDVDLDTSGISTLSTSDIEGRLRELRIHRIELEKDSSSDQLSVFLLQWIRQLEATSGLSPNSLTLIDPVVDGRPHLRQWRDSYLAPLVLLQNDFYPGEADTVGLAAIEGSSGLPAIEMLLQFAQKRGEKADIGRDLKFIVTPWISGTSGSNGEAQDSDNATQAVLWREVDRWLFDVSATNYRLAAKAVMEWDGPPEDVTGDKSTSRSAGGPQMHYIRTLLALVLKSADSGTLESDLLQEILDRAITLHSSLHASLRRADTGLLNTAVQQNLSEDQLLDETNPCTTPSGEVFNFLSECMVTRRILQEWQPNASLAAIAEVALFGTEERQKQELVVTLQHISQLPKQTIDWRRVREQLLLLAGTEIQEDQMTHKLSYLGRVPLEYLDSCVLDTLLSAEQYQVIKSVYLASTRATISRDTIREHITSAIFTAYDNATNCNRTRGGIKRASELLAAFRSDFPQAEALSGMGCLITATHSLSFYKLVIQQGVPFQPVNIRGLADPLLLIDKVLEQNSNAYTKLDDLLDIARNLVRTGSLINQDVESSEKSLEEKLVDVEHAVTFHAITKALSEHDFDTAYSYTTTRLTTSLPRHHTTASTDDTSWRAAYAAGKYRPSGSPKTLHDRINSLSKRMDLLSVALMLAPTPDALPEILATWRRSEEEMDSLKAQAIHEERVLEANNEAFVPGGFGLGAQELDAAETKRLLEKRNLGGFAASYEEEAPVGLFDMARGAANAFRKSAFPLGTNSTNTYGMRSGGQDVSSGIASAAKTNNEDVDDNQQKSRRKRDVVSGMVTGGLVSGMSWVLGATPATQQQKQ